jgi:CheY-like chemotaxis protein
MTPFRHTSVLIVDCADAFAPELRQRLVPLGLQVHVVRTPAMAIRIATAKRIDVAVLEYAMDPWATDLVRALKARDVSIVYTTPSASYLTSAHPTLVQPMAVCVS